MSTLRAFAAFVAECTQRSAILRFKNAESLALWLRRHDEPGGWVHFGGATPLIVDVTESVVAAVRVWMAHHKLGDDPHAWHQLYKCRDQFALIITSDAPPCFVWAGGCGAALTDDSEGFRAYIPVRRLEDDVVAAMYMCGGFPDLGGTARNARDRFRGPPGYEYLARAFANARAFHAAREGGT